jgi:hypothetical protein
MEPEAAFIDIRGLLANQRARSTYSRSDAAGAHWRSQGDRQQRVDVPMRTMRPMQTRYAPGVRRTIGLR